MRDITLIFGCMFSGKTTKLIEMYNYSMAEQNEKIAIKPLIDNRYIAGQIQSHGGLQLPGHRISKPEEIYPLVSTDIKEIYIDEIQFLGNGITGVVLDLSLQGIKIVAAGLDKDSNGEPFGPMPELLKWANHPLKLTAKCEVCQKEANNTFRKVASGEKILIGHSDLYEARCDTHWTPNI